MIDEDDDRLDADLPPNARDLQASALEGFDAAAEWSDAEVIAAEVEARAPHVGDMSEMPESTPTELQAEKLDADLRRDGHPIVKPGSAAQRRATLN